MKPLVEEGEEVGERRKDRWCWRMEREISGETRRMGMRMAERERAVQKEVSMKALERDTEKQAE